jgi:hypothetical protein
MKKILIALAIVTLVAGCGGSGQEGQLSLYPGASITSFYPVSPKAYAGGTITLFATVQNNGYFDATDAELTIYNCGNMNTGSVDGTGYNCNQPIPLSETLKKPERDVGIPGETIQKEITIETPKTLPKGESAHTFSARLLYKYESSSTRDVGITSFENYQEHGGNLQFGTLNLYSTPAPVSVAINAPSDAIILTSENKDEQIPVSVSVKNTGGGTVVGRTISSIKLCYDKNLVEVKEYRDFSDDSANIENVGKKTCLKVTKLDILQLIGLGGAQRTDATIYFKVKKDIADTLVQDVINFDASVEYTYSEDKSTQVTLIGN